MPSLIGEQSTSGQNRSSSAGSDAPGGSNAPRLYFAAVLAVGLVAAIAVVLVAASGDDRPAAVAADPECIRAWNRAPDAISKGRHQSVAHGYVSVQILRVDNEGQPVGGEGGRCAAVFAARALDPEPGAAAQVLNHGSWGSLAADEQVGSEQLGRLQSDAVAGANATLGQDGLITPTLGLAEAGPAKTTAAD